LSLDKAEVIQLMLEMLAMAGLKNVHLDLGHVGIYRGLVAQANLTQEQDRQHFKHQLDHFCITIYPCMTK
jgi:ATP phosphoribosyltransferase regulatory subunit HisZ